MRELVMVLIGVASTGVVLFLFKFLGSGKGAAAPLQDSTKVTAALETASELLGQRAMVEAKAVEDRQRVEAKLTIEDPVQRIEALAEELKDL